ncbi:hypothetical protein Tco_0417921 [Tanacetum coccineum]
MRTKRKVVPRVYSVPIPYDNANIASHGPTTGTSISVLLSMKGKRKLDGTVVHISDLPRIPQRRYKQILAVADNGSVREDEMPRGSTDPDDDNLWREVMENSCCAIIQGLSPNADIFAHTDNDLPRGHMLQKSIIRDSTVIKSKFKGSSYGRNRMMEVTWPFSSN